MEKKIEELISKMTLEEKASLCSGFSAWSTKPIERLGISSIVMTDGPHGVRFTIGEGFGRETKPSTCFPTAACMASTWDRELIYEVGKTIAKECHYYGISILLGPGVNIKRVPLCGRNFEYYSEDPLLSSEIASSFIKGVQSEGIGTSIKHFAANNQEYRRLVVDAKVDERTLREIYLASFEKAVKDAKPWTVMAAYNKLNGEYCTQNEYLLNDVLKEEWGFEGFVVSDWGAVDDRVKGLKAGLDLEMPGNMGINDKKIVEAIKKGELSEDILNKAVERILRIIFKAIKNKKDSVNVDFNIHHELAIKVAREGIVLLKNDDKILPIKSYKKIAIIGSYAKNPRFQGGGSSHLNPARVSIPYDEIINIVGSDEKVYYTDGYDSKTGIANKEQINEALKIAKNVDIVLIFAGLPEIYDTEGRDRPDLKLPKGQNELISEVTKVNKNVIVILMTGSAIEMLWVNDVKGIFECYLAGQGVGKAIADLLFGLANPCGKLAETFPKRLSDNPAYLNYPGQNDVVEYREGTFVGYRYYDKKDIEVLFPFGHGLSYTTFEYFSLEVENKEITENDLLRIKLKIKNTGEYPGKEIVQLYIRKKNSSIIRHDKELKAFKKIHLNPREEKELEFTLDRRAFAYYEPKVHDWLVEEGEYEILIGKSSRDIVLSETVYVKTTRKVKNTYTRNTLL
ncbi:glycosyl hydrolase [Dictyoglomus thermophilum]|nr:glycoside hydrolase family 3 C-terminal domain-containing protein [Dictyoglomus thermophilum]TYT24326.1 glycosyl hydrolase [Dictyoglomus thermophilum]